jgi:hypothetical protein
MDDNHSQRQILPTAFSGRAGIARRDLTGPVGIRSSSWGPCDWSASLGVHRPLTLTALALDTNSSAEAALLLLALDMGWWTRVDDEAEFRETVCSAVGVDAEHLLVSLSHTHASPITNSSEASLPDGALIPDYLERIREAAIDACREALDSMTPALLEWKRGRCDLASNRDLDCQGRALVGLNPDAQPDDTVVVGRLTKIDGGMLATLVNYACHPTTLAWQNRLLSPDYVGAMRELVESSTGSLCMFLQGASGDLAPRHQYTGDTELADRHGRVLGHSVLSVLNGMPSSGTTLGLTGIVESGAPLAIWEPVAYDADQTLIARRSHVEMDFQPLATIEELAEKWKDIDANSREERLRRARDIRDGYVRGPTVNHPLWTARIGNALLAAHPGEAYSRFQETLREAFPDTEVIVLNLTNGPGFVYLGTKEAYDSGAYAAWQSPLASDSLARLEHAAVEQLHLLREEAP